MSRLLGIIILVGVFLVSVYGWQYLTATTSLCDSPVLYRLDQLDSRFNITATQANKDIEQATEIWNKEASKKLFKEGPQAKLTVEFVYDQRQALSSKISSQENNLNINKKTLDVQISDFLMQKAAFETKLATLNQEINSWNQKGGAPADVYKQLQEQSQSIKLEGDKLQSLANSLNQNTGSYNYEVNQLNSTVSDFNAAISQRPEEGLFDGPTNTIYIYLDPSQKVLIHTLAHEFGHALGMGHVDDPKSIMYMYTSENLLPSPADHTELAKACQVVSHWRILISNIEEKIKVLLTDIQQKSLKITNPN